MTIKQFAQEHGITEQAVYKKLRNRGIKTTELRNHENTGGKWELSENGLNILNQLFSNSTETVNKPYMPGKIAALTAEVEQLTGRVKELEIENARLTGKLEAYEATSATLAATQEKTAEALATAQRLMDQQQQLHAMEIKALPGGGVKGWFSKLFKKGDGE